MTELKSIWHTSHEKPKAYVDIAFYVDGYLYSGYYEPQDNQYGIFGADKVEKWCYVKELSSYILALETENKDLSDKNGKLKSKLDKALDGLEYADKCLTGGTVGWKTEIRKIIEQIKDNDKDVK